MKSYVEVTKNKTGLSEPKKNNEDLLNSEMANSISEICNEYGLNGCFVSYRADTEMPSAGYYLVASLSDELPAPENLYDMYLERCRNSSAQYLDYYVEKVNPDDVMTSVLDMIEYCKTIEFLQALYDEYKLPFPKKLNDIEIKGLMDNASSVNDDDFTTDIKAMYRANVKNFFKIEKRHSKIGFLRKWDEFYRSDKYSEGSSKLKNIFYFFKRKKPRVSMKRLWDICSNISVVEYTQAEFKMFEEYMKTVHPDIPYAIASKFGVNNGEIKLPKGEENNKELNPFGRTVTTEEYNEELFKCLTENKPFEKIRIAKAKFVTVAYRMVDEPLMLSLYHRITLNYTKPCKYGDLIQRGDVSLTLIPYNEFMNFASLAKSNNVLFAIDDGYFYKPCLDAVTVIYNSYQEETIKHIKGRIVSDLTNNSHSSTAVKHKQSIKDQIQQLQSNQKHFNRCKYKELSL